MTVRIENGPKGRDRISHRRKWRDIERNRRGFASGDDRAQSERAGPVSRWSVDVRQKRNGCIRDAVIGKSGDRK